MTEVAEVAANIGRSSPKSQLSLHSQRSSAISKKSKPSIPSMRHSQRSQSPLASLVRNNNGIKVGQSELGPDEQFIGLGGDQPADQEEQFYRQGTRVLSGLYIRLCQTFVIEKGMQIQMQDPLEDSQGEDDYITMPDDLVDHYLNGYYFARYMIALKIILVRKTPPNTYTHL